MKLADISVKRPVFAIMMTAALIVLGAFSYRELGLDLMPKTDSPVVTVSISLPGASAEEVETQITKSGAEESVRRLAQQQLFENYQIADEKLAAREWFFDHFTAVDAHFFWCFRRGTQFNLDLSQFKNCMTHFERMKERPSVRKLLAYEQEVQTAFAQAA